MRAYTRAAQSYGSVQLVTGVATADNVQLIQMLFDGLSESLATARGHIQNDSIEAKSKALARAGRDADLTDEQRLQVFGGNTIKSKLAFKSVHH